LRVQKEQIERLEAKLATRPSKEEFAELQAKVQEQDGYIQKLESAAAKLASPMKRLVEAWARIEALERELAIYRQS
jgi:hypothetical protein